MKRRASVPSCSLSFTKAKPHSKRFEAWGPIVDDSSHHRHIPIPRRAEITSYGLEAKSPLDMLITKSNQHPTMIRLPRRLRHDPEIHPTLNAEKEIGKQRLGANAPEFKFIKVVSSSQTWRSKKEKARKWYVGNLSYVSRPEVIFAGRRKSLRTRKFYLSIISLSFVIIVKVVHLLARATSHCNTASRLVSSFALIP